MPTILGENVWGGLKSCRNKAETFAEEILGAKKTHKEKRVNKIFTGLSRDFGGYFLYVFFSPIGNDPKKTHKQNFGTHQSRDNPVNLFMFMCFFLSLKLCWRNSPRNSPAIILKFAGLN